MSFNVEISHVNCCFKDKNEKIFYIKYLRKVNNSLWQTQTTDGMGASRWTSSSVPKQNIHSSKFSICIFWNRMNVVYYEHFQLRLIFNGNCYKQLVINLKKDTGKSKNFQRHRTKMFFNVTMVAQNLQDQLIKL